MSRKRKRTTPTRYVEHDIIELDPEMYKKHDETLPYELPYGYIRPFLQKNLENNKRSEGMINNWQKGDMTKRQAYDEVFKHINVQRRKKKNKNIERKSKNKIQETMARKAPRRILSQVIADRKQERKIKRKGAKLRRPAILKYARLTPNYEGLTYREALGKRSLLQKSAKAYNSYLDNNKTTTNKLNWCRTIGAKVEEMINDKLAKFHDDAIKDLIKSKITGYKKAGQKTIAKSAPKIRKPKKIWLYAGQKQKKPYVRKTNRPAMTAEHKAKLYEAGAYYRSLPPEQKRAYSMLKKQEKEEKRQARAAGKKQQGVDNAGILTL